MLKGKGECEEKIEREKKKKRVAGVTLTRLLGSCPSL